MPKDHRLTVQFHVASVAQRLVVGFGTVPGGDHKPMLDFSQSRSSTAGHTASVSRRVVRRALAVVSGARHGLAYGKPCSAPERYRLADVYGAARFSRMAAQTIGNGRPRSWLNEVPLGGPLMTLAV